MAKALHYADCMHLARRLEYDFDQHLAFQLQLAGFVGVNRFRLGNDFNRRRWALRFNRALYSLRFGRTRVAKPALLNRAWTAGCRSLRCHAIAKAGACNRAANAARSAGAIALAGAFWQI